MDPQELLVASVATFALGHYPFCGFSVDNDSRNYLWETMLAENRHGAL